jgi:hypothetical protein
MRASDVRSLWRFLARAPQVRAVARDVASAPPRIEGLVALVVELLARPCEEGMRHADDLAVCAALVVLDRSPLTAVRELFDRLAACEEPGLVWVRRLAEYCRAKFVSSDYHAVGLAEEIEADDEPSVATVLRIPTEAADRGRYVSHVGADHCRLAVASHG